MDLRPYIDEIQGQLQGAAATGGEEARALAARLTATLDVAVRLSLLEVLAAAAQEITCELAPGSVEVRLRGRDPEFVVTTPAEPRGDAPTPEADAPAGGGSPVSVGSLVGDDGGVARINLRLPEHLKARVERAASEEGLSINSWLVRAVAAALERADPPGLDRRDPRGSQRFTGWAR